MHSHNEELGLQSPRTRPKSALTGTDTDRESDECKQCCIAYMGQNKTKIPWDGRRLHAHNDHVEKKSEKEKATARGPRARCREWKYRSGNREVA